MPVITYLKAEQFYTEFNEPQNLASKKTFPKYLEQYHSLTPHIKKQCLFIY